MCEKIKALSAYFSRGEKLLWSGSVLLILVSFLIFNRGSVLTLFASLIGVTSLIFNAKGNPFGQLLMVIFSALYGVVSYSFSYYGEMATYLGMTAPMSVFALVSWLKNPYQGNRAQVKIEKLSPRDVVFMLALTTVVTVVFAYILKAFHTANLIPSVISVITSFVAVFLTYKRSMFFALAYAVNDIVLIFLWTLASLTNTSYVSMITCFCIFLANDVYTFFNWRRMHKGQMEGAQ